MWRKLHGMRLIIYDKDSYVSELLTGGEQAVYGPDCDGFERFLGKCIDTRNLYGADQSFTWYIQDNIETRQVYDWDYLIQFYYSDLKKDRFYMADAFWHKVLIRNGIEAYRVMPIIELQNLLAAANPHLELENIKYSFTSLVNNRNDSRYWVHRHLVKNNLLNKCYWSWSNNRGLSSFFFNNKWAGIKEGEYEHFREHRQTGTIWEPDMGRHELRQHVISAVTLCYQTIYHGCGPVYDGKVFKCFLSNRPFVMIGSSGTLADLRDQGFRTFDGFIDESYDLEVDPLRRMEMILSEIDRLAAMPLADLTAQLWQIRETLEHNYQRCMELGLALDQRDLNKLIMPVCHHVADYDNLLSPNQLRG